MTSRWDDDEDALRRAGWRIDVLLLLSLDVTSVLAQVLGLDAAALTEQQPELRRALDGPSRRGFSSRAPVGSGSRSTRCWPR